MTEKFPEKYCKIHNVKMYRKPNSTIFQCPICLKEKNKELLKNAFNSKSKKSEMVNISKPKSEKVSRNKPVKWRDKGLNPMIKHVQEKFVNPYIRWRDEKCFGKCISSNGPIKHCGHFFPTSTHNGMRFHIMNMHGQSISSNKFKSGDLHNYRKGLRNRHGAKYVIKLDREEQLYKQYGKKFSRPDVIAIAETYIFLRKNEIICFDIHDFNRYYDAMYKKLLVSGNN